MPRLATDDGVQLHYEETGSGEPVLFIHEFAGDHRSWEPQVRFFGGTTAASPTTPAATRRRTCRRTAEAYSQERAVADADGRARCARTSPAVTSSASRWVASRRCTSVCDTPTGSARWWSPACGYGAELEKREQFAAEMEVVAEAFARDGAAPSRSGTAIGPSRVQFQNKNPRGWREFATLLAEHSSEGSALTMRGVQKVRPSLYEPPRRAGADDNPDAHRHRRRGRRLPGDGHHAQADHPVVRPRGASAHRPHLQPRGAGDVQRGRRALSLDCGARSLGRCATLARSRRPGPAWCCRRAATLSSDPLGAGRRGGAVRAPRGCGHASAQRRAPNRGPSAPG